MNTRTLSLSVSLSLRLSLSLYIYIYACKNIYIIYIYVCLYVCIYIHIYTRTSTCSDVVLSPQDLQEVVQLAGNGGAFAALRSDGRVAPRAHPERNKREV